ncbi:T9SS type A sorting domain-containing protein [Flavobacterium sp.]|uniref:T9SS type A sorting domain-containing protein n=1 Tax=Flavobacterium sp. TaxID=239 RepID=UPI002B4B560C|nr:T9SS type A sorting domain-containing protein [Flavobacterium sp.]HLF51124.1 T9SS type A sorting domain-containing protein [Flavobacterium sp.]
MKNLYLLLVLISSSLSAQFAWTPIPSIAANLNGQRFDDVFFLNENLGWAANGYYAAVYKTTDGGATWIQQVTGATLGGSHYFRNIEFLNENIGFLGTLNGKFYKTVNGGTTWSLVTNFSTNPAAICGLDAVGTSTIYGCGAYFSPAYIIKSTDSGNTWQYINMAAYASALVEIYFINENVGFVSGKNANGAVILKTIDGGLTWATLYNGYIPGQMVWKLQVLSGNTNVIFGSVESVSPNPGRLVKSVDGGLNWISKVAPEVDIQAVGFVSENHGWMGGHNTGFYETINGGDTWVNTGVGSNLNRIFFVGNIAYASGTTIYKYSDPNLSVADFEEHARVPLDIKISPNPVKDKLNIKIDFLASDHVVIELYSSSGQLIKKLMRDTIDTMSTKNYTFDFSYPSGTYIINFHTNTGRQSVKIIK